MNRFYFDLNEQGMFVHAGPLIEQSMPRTLEQMNRMIAAAIQLPANGEFIALMQCAKHFRRIAENPRNPQPLPTLCVEELLMGLINEQAFSIGPSLKEPANKINGCAIEVFTHRSTKR